MYYGSGGKSWGQVRYCTPNKLIKEGANYKCYPHIKPTKKKGMGKKELIERLIWDGVINLG